MSPEKAKDELTLIGQHLRALITDECDFTLLIYAREGPLRLATVVHSFSEDDAATNKRALEALANARLQVTATEDPKLS